MAEPVVSDRQHRSVHLNPAPDGGTARPGRRPSTTRSELERISLDLFIRRGFDATSVDDIAAAAGIGRRTFFRYFRSKNDAVWGDFDLELERWRDWFAACPADLPLLTAVRRGVVVFNTFDAEVAGLHRRRMQLILQTPALQAHSTLRYHEWRDVVADFVAGRLGCSASDLRPRVIGQLALGAALAAYEQWLIEDDSDLVGLLDRALSELEGPDHHPTGGPE